MKPSEMTTGVGLHCNGIVISLQPPTDIDSEDEDYMKDSPPPPFSRQVSPSRHASTASSGYGTLGEGSAPKARVKLPSRYLVRLAKACKDTDDNSNTTVENTNTLPNDKENRERDLGQALKWIRQEILQMREQDKTLTSEFIGLRSRILQLRCWLEIYGSTSDMSSFDGSSMSLEESRSPMSLSATSHSLLRPDNELEFRNRTSSMRIARRPPSICLRIAEKRRSKEYT